MSSYIGKVQIGSGEPLLIGSTLYGFCDSLANAQIKDITASTQGSNNIITGNYVNTNYDELIRGSTIHIKFLRGNTATQNVQLQVGLTNAVNVIGNFTCPANSVISFTLDESNPPNWIVNDNVDNNTTYTFAEGTTNGAISVTPSGGTAQSVSVHGLGDSAYKGVISDLGNNTSSADLPTAQAVAQYVQTQTGGLAGLTGAMHFRGIATVAVTDGGQENPTIANYDFGTNGANGVAGDVVIWGQQEYVWTADGTSGYWELLGDEGSYVLATSQTTNSAIQNITLNPGTLPQLTITATTVLQNVTLSNGSVNAVETTAYTIPNITSAGSSSTATVSQGILNITFGTAPTLGDAFSINSVNTASIQKMPVLNPSTVSVGSASGWEDGDLPSLNTPTSITVVTPVTTP